MKLASLKVTTPTPGFVARVLAGNSPSGGFSDDSSTQTVGSTTTLKLNGATDRYYVLWIKQLPPGRKAEVSELSGSR